MSGLLPLPPAEGQPSPRAGETRPMKPCRVCGRVEYHPEHDEVDVAAWVTEHLEVVGLTDDQRRAGCAVPTLGSSVGTPPNDGPAQPRTRGDTMYPLQIAALKTIGPARLTTREVEEALNLRLRDGSGLLQGLADEGHVTQGADGRWSRTPEAAKFAVVKADPSQGQIWRVFQGPVPLSHHYSEADANAEVARLTQAGR